MHKPPLSERAKGRWRGILSALGVPPSALNGKHGPCPACGGKDRFRFDDKDGRGSFYCSQCGAGDGVALVMRFTGLPFREAARKVEEHIGSAPVETRKPGLTDDQIRQALNRLWASAGPVREGDPVSTYLRNRVGAVGPSKAIRTAVRVRYQHEGGPASFHPAMVAMFQAPDGAPSTLHRTYLTADGCKADVPAARLFMPGGIAKGGAVRLCEPGPVLGIAEGIETALSASKLFDVPCWAACNAGLLAEWRPPEGTQEVIVFGDCDETFTGQAAAYQLAQRIRASGVLARVEIPSEIGSDWNDVLRATQGVEA